MAMQYELIGVVLLVLANIWVTISLIKALTDHINDIFTEMVEDLPPALAESMGQAMPDLAGNVEFNPIQMAIAQIIPKMFEKPAIEAKLMPKDEKGRFTTDNL
jgi:hypothetical protein